MRRMSIVLCLLMVPSLALAQRAFTPRPLDPIAAETLARALAGSALVRGMVARLEASDVIVHLATSAHLPLGIGGVTQFVTARGGYRYLRVTLDANLTLRNRSVILGHELKHACEVADSSAANVAQLRELFERAGHRDGAYFETQAAIETEREVRTELSASRSRSSDRVVKHH